MKNLFSLFTLLVASAAFSQIPNAGFESWSGSPLSPSGWVVTNDANLTTVFAVNDVHSGSLAARGAVISLPGGGTVPATMVASADGEGFPISVRYTALRGWYKYTAVGGDAFQVTSSMRLGRTVLGAGFFSALATTTVYREFVASTIWTSASVPDSANIILTIVGGGGTFHEGSAFVVDDLTYVTTDVKETRATAPSTFALEQNFPNPFNPTTKIQFSIPTAQFVTLKVYNLAGQEVATLVSEQMEAGKYRAEFDASSLPSGTYLYRLRAADIQLAKQMILTK